MAKKGNQPLCQCTSWTDEGCDHDGDDHFDGSMQTVAPVYTSVRPNGALDCNDNHWIVKGAKIDIYSNGNHDDCDCMIAKIQKAAVGCSYMTVMAVGLQVHCARAEQVEAIRRFT